MTETARWNELLEEFRALGGTAENLCRKEGQFGWGLFPQDPGRLVRLRVPENLLFDIDHIVFENGVLRAGPNSPAGDREKAWFESYERDYSWGGGGRTEVERFVEGIQALPGNVRQILAASFGLKVALAEFSDALVQSRFFHSRAIKYRKGRAVFMPIVELANHGHLTKYVHSNGVSIGGQFPGEILVDYGAPDAWGLLLNWGFTNDEPRAASISVSVRIKNLELSIGRDTDKGDLLEIQPIGQVRSPEFHLEGDKATLSFLTLEMKATPRIPKGIFCRLFRNAGLADAEEAFELVQHHNRMHFLRLIECIEGLEAPVVRTLRDTARFQLQTLSHCYGVRGV